MNIRYDINSGGIKGYVLAGSASGNNFIMRVSRAAKKLHIVLDNLNTHFETSLQETFGSSVTKRLMERIEFHYTPTHGSWLNMAEIELSILGRQCVNRRLPTKERVVRETSAWQAFRNDRQATLQWKFTTRDARNVFKEYYENLVE